MKTPTTLRVIAALASLAITVGLFDGVASLADVRGPSAVIQLAQAASAKGR